MADVYGQKVPSSTRLDAALDAARAFGIRIFDGSERPRVRQVLEELARSAGIADPRSLNEARLIEAGMVHIGLTYDPYWDSTETRADVPVTAEARAFARLAAGASGVARCFILNVSDGARASAWERDHRAEYRYGANVTTAARLNDAGPGSLAVFYATGTAAESPMHFVAVARIGTIHGGREGPWKAEIADYREFGTPIRHDRLDLPGWNRQHAISEITPATFAALVHAGSASSAENAIGYEAALDQLDAPYIEPPETVAEVVRRLKIDFPVEGHVAPLSVPESLPVGLIEPSPIHERNFDSVEGLEASREGGKTDGRSTSSRGRDKAAEERAIEIATCALEAGGWKRGGSAAGRGRI